MKLVTDKLETTFSLTSHRFRKRFFLLFLSEPSVKILRSTRGFTDLVDSPLIGLAATASIVDVLDAKLTSS